jgi:hypothetical protein
MQYLNTAKSILIIEFSGIIMFVLFQENAGSLISECEDNERMLQLFQKSNLEIN